MNFRKMTAFLTALMTMVSLTGMPVFAEESNVLVQSDDGNRAEYGIGGDLTGSLGDSVSFILNGNILMISGKGEITVPIEKAIKEEYLRERIHQIDIDYFPGINEITGLGVDAFRGLGNLTQVNLPESLENIGPSAFMDCSSLKYIDMPDTVKYIGDGAFIGCTSLGKTTLPSGLKKIGEGAFWGCKKLEISEFPDGLKSIGIQAFGDCPKLTDITIPDSVTFIGTNAFGMCTGLKRAVIGHGIKEAVWGIFAGCSSLEEISIPEFKTNTQFTEEGGFTSDNSVLTMFKGKDSSFVEVKKITVLDGAEKISDLEFGFMDSIEEVSVPETVTEIGRCAFVDCKSLKKINIPVRVKSIGSGAFGLCENLEIPALPEGLETIGEQAFSYNTTVEALVIPSTVSYIGNQAFQGCTNLKDIWFGGSRKQWEASIAEYTDTDDLKDVTVHFDAVFSKYSPEEIEKHRGSGDVDENGITDLTDLSRISLYLIGDYEFKEPALVLADMDKDGKVTLADLATLRMILSHKI